SMISHGREEACVGAVPNQTEQEPLTFPSISTIVTSRMQRRRSSPRDFVLDLSLSSSLLPVQHRFNIDLPWMIVIDLSRRLSVQRRCRVREDDDFDQELRSRLVYP
ncbi:unnamed protein product, partial [Urochloa humidicola]